MNSNLLMNFSADKENKKIVVDREFAAPLDKVWAAWTTAELLDQWWAPKPWKNETKLMDFREGGLWLYSMKGPDGSRHYCRADYDSITPLKHYSGLDAFCDEEGNINTDFPRTYWSVTFKDEANNKTLVHIENNFDKLEDLEKIIEMGFQEGFTMGLQNLDELLASQS